MAKKKQYQFAGYITQPDAGVPFNNSSRNIRRLKKKAKLERIQRDKQEQYERETYGTFDPIATYGQPLARLSKPTLSRKPGKVKIIKPE